MPCWESPCKPAGGVGRGTLFWGSRRAGGRWGRSDKAAQAADRAKYVRKLALQRTLALVRGVRCGVCKTFGSAYVGSNPTPATRFRRSKLVMQNCVTGILVQNERFCATDVNCATDIDVTQIGGSGSEPGYIRDRRARHFSRGSM